MCEAAETELLIVQVVIKYQSLYLLASQIDLIEEYLRILKYHCDDDTVHQNREKLLTHGSGQCWPFWLSC